MSWFRRRKLLKLARNGARGLLGLTVKDVMTDYVVTIAPEKTAVDAAAIMVGEDKSALIVEVESRPVGILTERDFISKVPISPKVFALRVKDIMSRGFAAKKGTASAVESVRKETTLAQARSTLKEKRIRKLVVTTPDGLLAGIVTQTDISKAIYEHLHVVARIDAPFLVQDVMTRKVGSVQRKASFSDVKRLMAKANLSSVPVIDGKEYVGIFTEYDVVSQFYDAGGKLDIKEVSALMKSPIKAIPAGLNIFDANTVMLFEKVRRLLVVEEKKVVGIVTQTDLVHACLDYLAKSQAYLAEHPDIKEEDLVELRRSNTIISEYTTEHIRSFTMR